MNYQKGFTIIELLIVIAIAGVSSIFFFVQKNDIEIAARDSQRKTSINAIYYGLEEVYYKQKENYPRTISSDTLPYIDPASFTDPNGVSLGEGSSDYYYEATDCEGDVCKNYKLSANLEAEDKFTKTSKN